MLELFKRDTGKSINVNELDKLLGSIELIDIREPYEFHGGSIRTAKNIPMGNLLSEPGKYLKKDKPYYIMCQSGARSQRTCSILSKHGFDVINVSGGISTYAGSKR